MQQSLAFFDCDAIPAPSVSGRSLQRRFARGGWFARVEKERASSAENGSRIKLVFSFTAVVETRLITADEHEAECICTRASRASGGVAGCLLYGGWICCCKPF